MAITKQENIAVCKDSITFSFNKEKIEEATTKIAAEIGKKHKIKGFRKGKATPDAVKIVAKDYVLEEAKKRLINEAYQEILYETKLKPFGEPELLKAEISFSDFVLQINLSYTPSIELKKYKDFELVNPTDLPTKEEVIQQTILNLCKQHFIPRPFNDDEFVVDGDNVVVNYNSTVEGLPIKNGEGLGVVIDVGNGQIFRDFETNIMGMQVGEKRSFELSFPENIKNEDVAGKLVNFDVELVGGMKKENSEFNETLVEKVGVSSFEELNKLVLDHSLQQINSITKNELKKQVFDQLLLENDINIPEWMELKSAQELCRANQINWEESEQAIKDHFIKEGIKTLKLSLIFDKIRESEVETVLTEQEVQTIISQNLGRMPADVQKQVLQEKNYNTLSKLYAQIQDEQVFEWVIKNSTIKLKEVEQKEESEQEQEKENA